MQDLRTLLNDKELIVKTDKYELYIDRKTNNVWIYSVELEDVWEIGVDDLGNMGFNHYIS
jgi:hypothetical protein